MSIRKWTALVLGLVAAVGATAVLAGPALALRVYGGKAPSAFGAGALKLSLDGVAVDATTGEAYVATLIKVDIFEGSGAYQSSLANPAGYGLPKYLAVDNSSNASDPSAGDLYVGYYSGGVAKFTANGSFLSALALPAGTGNVDGVAVDPSGNVWVDTSEGYVFEFGDEEDNGLIGEFKLSVADTPVALTGIAVDAGDDVYLVAKGSASAYAVLKFTATGKLVGETPVASTPGVAVDPASGALLLSEAGYVAEYNAAGESVSWRTPGGAEIDHIGEGQLSSTGFGIAVDPASGALYVVDPGAEDVVVFPASTLPDLSVGHVESPQATSVGVAASVDPAGVAVSECELEYGSQASGAMGSSLPCETAPGAGGTPVPESFALGELTPGTTYRYRLAAGNAEGSLSSRTQRFTTAPRIDGTPVVAGVTSFAASLYATIYPGPELVTPLYHFAYGLTSKYEASLPAPDLAAGATNTDQTVSQTLTGLQPGTTYHFTLMVTNLGGGVTIGPDETFTTRPLSPPVLSTAASSAISQTGATLAGTIDPQGLTTSYWFEYGTSTGYGARWPTIAAFAGSGSSGQPVAMAIEGLQPGTTYHYRLVARSEDGTTYGADRTFTTAPYPASAIAQAPLSRPVGIARVAAAKTKSLTRAQKLARALRACRRMPRKRRAACMRKAHRRYRG